MAQGTKKLGNGFGDTMGSGVLALQKKRFFRNKVG